MITSEMKDRVLNLLVQSSVDMQCNFDMKYLAKSLDIGFNELDSIINQFESLGFCSVTKCLGGHTYTVFTADAHDFLIRGGFFVQEEIFRKQIEKLLFEIESLKPSMLDKVETITTIAANIRTFFKII